MAGVRRQATQESWVREWNVGVTRAGWLAEIGWDDLVNDCPGPVSDIAVFLPLSKNACHTRSIALRIGATAPLSTGVISGWLHPSGAARSLCAEGTYRSLLTLTCLASRKLRARVKTRFAPAKRPASKESLRQYPIEGVDLVGSGFTRGDQRIARCGREPAPAGLLGIAP